MKKTIFVLVFVSVLLVSKWDCSATVCYHTCVYSCAKIKDVPGNGRTIIVNPDEEYCTCMSGAMWISCDQEDYGQWCYKIWYSEPGYGNPDDIVPAYECEIGDFCDIT